MPHISEKISRSLNDYIILPGWTTEETTYDKVDLSVELAPDVVLEYPFIAAAMACVTGYDMALSCANNGMMAVVPCSLSVEDQIEIIKRVKEQEVKRGDLELTDPEKTIYIKENKTVSDAIKEYNEHGHSTIPICDWRRYLKGIFRYKEGISGRYHNLTLADALERVRNGDDGIGEIISYFDLDHKKHGTDYFWETDKNEDIHSAMKAGRIRCLPLVNKNGTLIRLAFIYKFNGYAVGAAIHTHEGWEKRAAALVEVGANVIFGDSSDAKSDFYERVIRDFKKEHPDVPFCAGNVTDAEGYRRLVEAGADIIKGGMGTGGSCITSERRGIGRGMATILQDLYEERERNARKVPIIADGGIGAKTISKKEIEMFGGKRTLKEIEHDPASIAKALAWADAVMMGTGFNVFEEAAGETIEIGGKRYKERWGEGSRKAKTIARYGMGELVRRADIVEGAEDYVSCTGRLKRGTEAIALNLKMTFSNVGARNLEEFRDKVRLELLSHEAKKETGVGE